MKTDLKTGDLVMIPYPHEVDGSTAFAECEVVDVMSEQFTVETPDGHIQYLFYRDENVTWEPL